VASLTAPLAAPSTTATVQTAATGPYRPGGTSSYIGSIPAQNMEIATRPAPPATSASTLQQASPGMGTIPWTPVGTATPATNGTATQRY
jgi:hypothetical protein